MINLAKDIRPISYVKSHTAEMIKQVAQNRNPIVITQNGEAKAVLLDIDVYQDLVDSIHLMKIISIGENDFRNGKYISNDDLDKKIQDILV